MVQENEDEVSLDDSPDPCESTTCEESKFSNSDVEKKAQFSENESKNVNRLRLLVFFALAVAAIAVATTVYQVVRKSQQTEIITRFRGVSGRVIDAFISIPNEKIGPLGSLRVAYTAQARDTNSTWPFVTLTSFQQRASIVKRLTESLHVAFLPLVEDKDRKEWEAYVPKSRSWMKESVAYESKVGLEVFSMDNSVLLDNDNMTTFSITTGQPGEIPKPDNRTGPFLPCWQSSPFLSGYTNLNVYNAPFFTETVGVLKTGALHISDFIYGPKDATRTSSFSGFLSNAAQKHVNYEGDALSHIFLPVFQSFNQTDTKVVAIIFALFQWSAHFKNLLSNEEKGIILVLENGCSQPFTYGINGKDVIFLGTGDLHNTNYDYMMQQASFSSLRTLQDGTEYGVKFKYDHCPVAIRLYPSQEFVDSITTGEPFSMAMIVLIVFVFTIVMFLFYDRLVERRQKLVLNRAVQSTAIVSSLFPKAYADRLLQQNTSCSMTSGSSYSSSNKRLKSFLIGDIENTAGEQPIADLFPFATVLIADIAGFTAWSSTREPAQVFVLLQKLYQTFDTIAQKRRVFKVETIGDSYVAVTGVPEPQQQHAVIMARFARECQKAVILITSNLGLSLGPDTCDLRMRIGIHSGPVTAGVLKGERARFQLFGDTVNVAARMESTGIPTKIHISLATATLLIQADKGQWVRPREDSVQIKGKGLLNTFWLVEEIVPTPTSIAAHDEIHDTNIIPFSRSTSIEKKSMLVSWICELLHVQMKYLIASRGQKSETDKNNPPFLQTPSNGVNPLDEVVEVIVLPEYKGISNGINEKSEIEIDAAVKEQLNNFIYAIASSYHDNHFHNFEHACHVTMSVNKLLMRVATPDVDIENIEGDFASHLYDYSHGINSDPITILAIIFSAVIHDLDHRGVSNVQLMKEEPEMGNMYKGKSVAEQNSLDIAWKVFMMEEYNVLRKFLFRTEEEMKRFRQVLVNVVLATDIFDKELNDLRKKRWEKAFSSIVGDKCNRELQNLRATIVIEHVIQASDVAHTMQHWHVYRKWNNKLFREMYSAFKNGRMQADPTDFWYIGELNFFDNYIIPLAKKLKECRVFGVSSDEYLIYAEQNRAEWEARGEELVSNMVDEIYMSGDC